MAGIALGNASGAGADMIFRRAMNPRTPDATTIYGGSRAGSGLRLSGMRASDNGRNPSAAGITQSPMSPEQKLQQEINHLKLENERADLELAKSLQGDKSTLAHGQLQSKLAETQQKQIGNAYKVYQLTADQDGISPAAGAMFDQMRWLGGKTKGTIAQGYTDEQGNKRIRLVRQGNGLTRDANGDYVNGQQQLIPVEHDGQPVDFSVDALNAMVNGAPKTPKPAYQTGLNGQQYMVQGAKATPVQTASGEGLTVARKGANGKESAALNEADAIFARMSKLPENKEADPNQLWLDSYAQAAYKSGNSNKQRVATFYEGMLKKLLPIDPGPEDVAQAQQTADQLAQEFAKRLGQQGDNKSSGQDDNKDSNKVMKSMPPASDHPGKVILNKKTGKRYKSDGQEWQEIG